MCEILQGRVLLLEVLADGLKLGVVGVEHEGWVVAHLPQILQSLARKHINSQLL